MRSMAEFMRNESGATAIEYGLICGLVFLAIVTALNLFATNTNLMYTKLSGNIK